jgi:hypothetical protein
MPNHDWAISSVPAGANPSEPAVYVVAVCRACGDVRVYLVQLGNQSVNLAGACSARPSYGTPQ